MSQADSLLRRIQDARSALDQAREYMEELREINRTLNHGTQVLYDHIATLKAERDAARQDTARLDALAQYAWSAHKLNSPKGWAIVVGAQWVNGRTLREAIDKAAEQHLHNLIEREGA
jgi:hypothetical protein